MTSTRNTLLDATQASILDVGLRRTTLADVARRAGVSRMTVYRQFDDLQTLVAALLTREITALLAEVDAEVAPLATTRERLVAACVRTVERLRDHSLFTRLLDLDPELLMPFVFDRFGSSQRASRDLIAAQLRAGDGSVRDLDVEAAATTIQLICQSFVFSARLVDEGAMKELRHVLESYLGVAALR
ncbi:MAG: transcriptional regulator, TetR family [Frankiales bacterium]|nr:transcriptional regulator, TetR family [Frankiales bacterium]